MKDDSTVGKELAAGVAGGLVASLVMRYPNP